MTRKLTTKTAAEFCTARGRPITAKSLQNYRIKGPEDPGEHGPKFYRDPVSGWVYYDEVELAAWVDGFKERLVEGARQPRAPWLDVA